MRWSYPSTFFIFAVLFAAEVAVSAPINVDLDELLEARSPARVTRSSAKRAAYRPPVTRSQTAPAPPKADDPPKASTSKPKDGDKSQLFKPEDFKAASETYRKQAKTTLHRTGKDGFVESDTGKGLAPGKQGDHKVEAQTLAKELNDKGYKKSDYTPRTRKRVRKLFNSKQNMVGISAKLNRIKGQHTTSRLKGGEGVDDPHLKKYLKKDLPQTKIFSKEVSEAFKKGGKITDVDLLTQHMKTVQLSDSGSESDGSVSATPTKPRPKDTKGKSKADP